MLTTYNIYIFLYKERNDYTHVTRRTEIKRKVNAFSNPILKIKLHLVHAYKLLAFTQFQFLGRLLFSFYCTHATMLLLA